MRADSAILRIELDVLDPARVYFLRATRDRNVKCLIRTWSTTLVDSTQEDSLLLLYCGLTVPRESVKWLMLCGHRHGRERTTRLCILLAPHKTLPASTVPGPLQ